MSAMSNKVISTIVKLAVASLAIGIVISIFNVSPRRILDLLGSTAQEIIATIVSVFEWAFQYILVGAIVVIPIWLVMVIWRTVRNKSKTGD